MLKSRLWIYILILFICTRFLFFAEAVQMAHSFHLKIPLSMLFSLLDGFWYVNIARHGYDVAPQFGVFWQGHANYVFFPLYPFLIKGGIVLTHLPAAIVGQILSSLCFLVSLFLFYHVLRRSVDERMARIGCLLLALSPYNVYYMAVYTESLFLMLSLIFWLAALNQRWFWMGVAGFLMAATHPNGVLIILFAIWFAWEDYQKTHDIWRYCPVLMIPLSLIGYMIYLHFHVGDALAFVHNEEAHWQRAGWHWRNLTVELQRQSRFQMYNISIYLMGLALSVLLYRRGYRKEALMIPVFTSLALLSGSFVSLSRYTAGLFPFYMGLLVFVKERKSLDLTLLFLFLLSLLLMSWWVQQFMMAF
ncbi:MAG: glycosyltransferase family 39 protein [Gammaproteobacteria bacterium]|nr:glycosyltransferase family 39 protein [Gammaproteobacteria bacterium]